MDVICDNRHAKISDSPVAYFSRCNSCDKFSCHNHEHLENISDRSQISAPDISAAAECNTINALKCRKSVVTALYVYGLFMIFYLPFWATMIMRAVTGYTLTVKTTYNYTAPAVFINPCLNPLVYCWRITEIRLAVKNTLSKN